MSLLTRLYHTTSAHLNPKVKEDLMPVNKINSAKKLAAQAFSGDETALKDLINDRVITYTPIGADSTDAKLKGFIEGIDFVLNCVQRAKQDRKLRALNVNISTDW
jgi:NADPH:quinone reductase-like Zn-dependent oxidoreductase